MPIRAASGYGKAPRKRRGADQGKSGPRAHGFTFTKTLGQHILKSQGVIADIIKKAGIRDTDVVLEIGPGTGNLTMQMLPLCKKVIAVEFDPRMVAELSKRVSQTPYKHKLQIIHQDVMQVDLPFFNLCVANIPYNISSALTFKLLAHRPMFRAAVIMYQLEFAQRLYAQPGSPLYSRISANTQLLARVDHLLKVPKQHFRPPPKVDSAVVRIEPKSPPPPVDFTEWDGLTRLCFQRKNKTVAAVFKDKKVVAMLDENYKTHCALRGEEYTPVTKDKIQSIIEQNGFEEARASKLDVDELMRLLAAFNSEGLHFGASSA